MATYVSDGKGNKYERKYSSDGTYTDHYAGKDRGDTVKGNPDANSSYRPSNGGGSSGSSSSKYDGSGNNADSSGKYSNDYRNAMLDKNNLPDGLTRPTDGKFRSTDVVGTEYRQTSTGNIIRIDKLAGGGTHQTLIPNTNWRQTGAGDKDLGNIYNKQNSAYSAVTYFDKDMNRPPSGYSANAASDWLSNALKQANATTYNAPTVPTLAAATPSVPQLPASTANYFNNNFGGIDAYVAGQTKRYNDALATGNADLIQRLKADAARVGYSLPTGGGVAPVTATAQVTVPQIDAEFAQVPAPGIDFNNPFQYQPYQYTTPPVSMTSDGSDSWTPTLNSVNQWYGRQDQLRNDYLNQQYRNQTLAQQQAQMDWEKEIYNSPYEQALRDMALQQAQAELQATQALEAQRIAAANRPSGSSGGSSYSGGSSGGTTATPNYANNSLNNTQQYAAANQWLADNASKFKRPIDLAAQIKRNAEAGKMNPSVATKALGILQDMYPTESSMTQNLSTWGK